MEFTIDGRLAEAIFKEARALGATPQAVVIAALRRQFLDPDPALEPRDEWERRLFSVAKDCGPVPPSAWTREEMYD